MDKSKLNIYNLMKEYCMQKNNVTSRPYNEYKAINANEPLKYDKKLMNELQTDTYKNYSKYVNKYIDTQEHTGNPVYDISIDYETISQMTESIANLISDDYDFVQEIMLNKNDYSNGGNIIYDIFNSFIRTLLLTELFLNRRINYNINYDNIPPEEYAPSFSKKIV